VFIATMISFKKDRCCFETAKIGSKNASSTFH
jgi:hypothetical protein